MISSVVLSANVTGSAVAVGFACVFVAAEFAGVSVVVAVV